jgi:putative ABC transport system permease protein
MEIIEASKIASKTLSANKLRSLLTMLGIVIGNWSVVLLVGVVQGVQTYTLEQIESYGRNSITVWPGGEDLLGGEGPERLVLADADAIKIQAPAVREIAPQISASQLISYQNRAIQSTITGTTPGFPYVRNTNLAKGRFFSASEQLQNPQVVVLGSELARKLFGTSNPLGQEVTVKNTNFRVIGIMQSKGSFGGSNQDDVALIPITVMASQIDGRHSPYGVPIDSIEISAQDKESIQAAVFQITNLLIRRHNSKDFTLQTNKAFQDLITQVAHGLGLLLAAIASISLLVGGIGIMNIMLVSVGERTHEIGLKKAIGATRQDILQQFLLEAVILSATGSLAGTLLGVGSIATIALLTPLEPSVSLISIILTTTVSGSIGLIFGVVPAQRASKLDPIVALRSA